MEMLSDFIDFCGKLFPSIDPYTKERAKRTMEQFESIRSPALIKIYNDNELYQGDIFTEIPFAFINEKGEYQTIICKAQLLSNSCDATRDDNLLFAAIHPLKDLGNNPSIIDGIKKNKRYASFYLKDPEMKDYFVDFELINTIPREVFLSLCEQNKVKRIASLSLVGYYMLLCKLTVFFMRPEDAEVNQSRNIETN